MLFWPFRLKWYQAVEQDLKLQNPSPIWHVVVITWGSILPFLVRVMRILQLRSFFLEHSPNMVVPLHETHWGGYFLRTNFSLRTKIPIFERRFEFKDCICFNRNSTKSNRIQAAGENCRKSAATAARAPD